MHLKYLTQRSPNNSIHITDLSCQMTLREISYAIAVINIIVREIIRYNAGGKIFAFQIQRKLARTAK